MTNKEYLISMNKIMKYLMGYDDTMKLTKFMILRIQGLPTGKQIANNHIQSQAKYSYETIIDTFRYFKFDIDKTLNSVQIKDEMHKFNLILSVVERRLNDTVMIERKKEETIKKQENINVDSLVHSQVEYQTKSIKETTNNDNKLKNEMKGLW